jgi:transposase
MSSVLMVACDDHCRKMVLKVGVDREEPVTWRSGRSAQDRDRLYQRLREQARRRGAERIVFAYEASGQGFGLYDELRAEGVEAHVLAPSKMSRSPKQRKNKNDEKDAVLIYDVLKAHVLAGNKLPTVCVPAPQLRDDRECTRARVDVGEKISHVKTQMRALLRRNQVEEPEDLGAWTRRYRTWLVGLTEKEDVLGWGAGRALASFYRQLVALEAEEEQLDQAVAELARQARWAPLVEVLDRLKGVALLLAMVFLTELGDVRRFGNRKKVTAAIGLAPSAHESGEVGERKGHITKQGPPRLRKMLCQAAWLRVGSRGDPRERAHYQKLAARNPNKKKIAIVACMRRLAIVMYHAAKEVAIKEDGAWHASA